MLGYDVNNRIIIFRNSHGDGSIFRGSFFNNIDKLVENMLKFLCLNCPLLADERFLLKTDFNEPIKFLKSRNQIIRTYNNIVF